MGTRTGRWNEQEFGTPGYCVFVALLPKSDNVTELVVLQVVSESWETSTTLYEPRSIHVPALDSNVLHVGGGQIVHPSPETHF